MPNKNDCEKMQKLKTDISKDEKLNAQVESYNAKNKIIFYAFPNVRPLNEKQQIQMEQNDNKLQITLCYWGRTSPQQETKRYPQYDFHISDHTLSDIKKYLGAIREKESNWFKENKPARKAADTANIVKSKNKDTHKNEKIGKNRVTNEGSQDDENTIIATVLKENVPDDKFWMNKEHNPWKKYSFQDEKTYILSCDFENIKKYIGNEGKMVQSNVLPQPYIGDPDAPIWLLLMNPSYSAADIYDMVRCDDDIKQKVIASIKSDDKRVYTDKEVNELMPYFFMENSEFQLDDRKNLMRQQLSFTSTQFYVLEPEFHTVRAANKIAKKQDKVARRDSSCQGSYEWWNKYLLQQDICNKKPDNLKKFFVLESFPYHSEKYDEKLRPQVEHFRFWVKMVVYALLNKKILLCRESIGTLVAKVAKLLDAREIKVFFNIENAMKDKIFVSTSSGSFSVSKGNFVSLDSKPHFDKIITHAMN